MYNELYNPFFFSNMYFKIITKPVFLRERVFQTASKNFYFKYLHAQSSFVICTIALNFVIQ